MIKKNIDWRRQELGKGEIEIVSTQTDELVTIKKAQASEPPAGSLPKEDTFDLFDPYLALYGWEENA